MTDPAAYKDKHSAAYAQRLAARHQREKRFRLYGLLALALAFGMLVALVGSIAERGVSGFSQTRLKLPVTLDAARIDPQGIRDPRMLARADYGVFIKESLRALFPDVQERKALRDLYALASSGARYELRDAVLDNPDMLGNTVSLWVTASDDVDMFMKGKITRNQPERQRKLSDQQIGWVDELSMQGKIKRSFYTELFLNADSREPEQAGVLGSAVGSLLTLLVCLVIAFPLGVLSAVYLEEMAPRNRFTDFIEVNINNLAAVPSIIFGLLGLAVYLSFFGLPRSAPVAGGLTLALMVLPTIIITTRVALAAVPGSIREAARGLGASPLQVVMHHVVPLAMPGIMTGTILATARALGETAPLLMIGMVAFVADIPAGFTDPATALPVQIYLWSDSPELAFAERTCAAILVLLALLVCMNGVAIALRRKFEKRW